MVCQSLLSGMNHNSVDLAKIHVDACRTSRQTPFSSKNILRISGIFFTYWYRPISYINSINNIFLRCSQTATVYPNEKVNYILIFSSLMSPTTCQPIESITMNTNSATGEYQKAEVDKVGFPRPRMSIFRHVQALWTNKYLRLAAKSHFISLMTIPAKSRPLGYESRVISRDNPDK